MGTRLVTNAQDTTYFEQQTLPFGTALNESPPTGGTTSATNRRFTTYDRNLNTGLDYAINRHYDPQQGRFTQVDPIGMGSVSLGNPQTLNLYAYCTNDPINRIDPSGLGFISFLKKLLNRVVNALIHAAITAAFSLIFTGNPGAALAAGVADFLKELGFPTKGFAVKIGGTPQWNPNAVSILSGGPSALSRYIIYNLTQAKYNADRVARRVNELLSLISAILGAQWDAILNNKEDKQSFALSLCHAAQESGFQQVVQLNGQVQGVVGPDGDLGLFQIRMPAAQAAATGMGIGTVTLEQVRDNDALNTRLATNHLQTAIDRFGGDVRKGLGAYKQGVSGVLRRGLTVKSQEYADGILQCERRLTRRSNNRARTRGVSRMNKRFLTVTGVVLAIFVVVVIDVARQHFRSAKQSTAPTKLDGASGLTDSALLSDRRLIAFNRWSTERDGNPNLSYVIRASEERDCPGSGVKLTILNNAGVTIYEDRFCWIDSIHPRDVLRKGMPQLVIEANLGGNEDFLKVLAYQDGKVVDLTREIESDYGSHAEVRPQFRSGIHPQSSHIR